MSWHNPDVPDTAMVTGQVLVTCWLDQDGDPCVTTTATEGQNRLTTVGLLEYAKLGLYVSGSHPEDVE